MVFSMGVSRLKVISLLEVMIVILLLVVFIVLLEIGVFSIFRSNLVRAIVIFCVSVLAIVEEIIIVVLGFRCCVMFVSLNSICLIWVVLIISISRVFSFSVNVVVLLEIL